ncbi:MAG: hypothetical protein WAT12_11000 [Candidatus Nitrotoga sp.]
MKLNFFVADEFRPETGGKQMVLGLYADDVILLEPVTQIEAIPVGFERLAFLINISDVPAGKHNYKGQIVDPSGKPYGREIIMGELEIEKGMSRSFIIEMKPFLINSKGTYHLNFYVDDDLYAFPFSIIDRVQEKPSTS